MNLSGKDLGGKRLTEPKGARFFPNRSKQVGVSRNGVHSFGHKGIHEVTIFRDLLFSTELSANKAMQKGPSNLSLRTSIKSDRCEAQKGIMFESAPHWGRVFCAESSVARWCPFFLPFVFCVRVPLYTQPNKKCPFFPLPLGI